MGGAFNCCIDFDSGNLYCGFPSLYLVAGDYTGSVGCIFSEAVSRLAELKM